MTGAATIFFAYIVFDAVATAGEESGPPHRDPPTRSISALPRCTVLYTCVPGLPPAVGQCPQIGP